MNLMSRSVLFAVLKPFQSSARIHVKVFWSFAEKLRENSTDRLEGASRMGLGYLLQKRYHSVRPEGKGSDGSLAPWCVLLVDGPVH